MPRVLLVDPLHPDAATLAIAADALRRGELVAFPTETVYGLGANALDAEAVARIFAAKGRPANNPLIVHVADLAMARSLVAEWPAIAERLAGAFWPGPLTLVLPRGPQVPDAVTAGGPNVGVRMPSHPVALALIRQAGVPIAAPSANPYMGVSPTLASHVAGGLGDRVAVILDGGPAAVGLESTVLDLTRAEPTVLRPGGLAISRLREQIGPVAWSEHGPSLTAAGPLPSPGLARRHYAPKASFVLAATPDAAIAAAIARHDQGARVALITPGAMPLPEGITPIVLGADPAAYGSALYACLHEADAAGFDALVALEVPATEAWAAVRDRLKRAASP